MINLAARGTVDDNDKKAAEGALAARSAGKTSCAASRLRRGRPGGTGIAYGVCRGSHEKANRTPPGNVDACLDNRTSCERSKRITWQNNDDAGNAKP